MDQVRVEVPGGEDDGAAPREERVAPRFTLLIRSAKLIGAQGEFICVIRDVSTSGISLRGFHTLPSEGPLRLELQSGETHAIEEVWRRGHESGYRFLEPVEVHDLVANRVVTPSASCGSISAFRSRFRRPCSSTGPS